MKGKRHNLPRTLEERFPPSAPCGCDICKAYCQRPGWWSVKQAQKAIEAGFGRRMMLEVAPDCSFGVLSPAFRGCEGGFALQEYAHNGCGFLKSGLCELHGTGFQPLECRFCHHARMGRGTECHAALERDWNSPAGQALVKVWIACMGTSSPSAPVRLVR